MLIRVLQDGPTGLSCRRAIVLLIAAVVTIATVLFYLSDLSSRSWVLIAKSSQEPEAAVTVNALGSPTQAGTTGYPDLRYVFAFGDSYTSLGYKIDGIQPSVGNPFGNPPWPGKSSAIGPNWIDNVIEAAPNDTLCYNFATGAAVIDVDIVRPPLSLVPFPYQVRNFTRALDSVLLDVPWTAENSIAMLWFGVNDCAAAQVYTKMSTPKDLVDRIMDSYFTNVKALMETGLRRFLFMGVPPLHRLPFALQPTYKSLENLTYTCNHWDKRLQQSIAAFAVANPKAELHFVKTAPYFHQAIDSHFKFGARDAICKARDGTSCLWVDNLHPGVAIAGLVGKGIFQSLTNMQFWSHKTQLPIL